MLIVGIYAMHRDPTLWDSPLAFEPDRFGRKNSRGRDRWQYLPFGAGPRSCIGDHFAMIEATLALATIIRRTEIDSVSEEFPMIVPFTTVAAEPILARTRIRPTQST
jgi:cytochrome P450